MLIKLARKGVPTLSLRALFAIACNKNGGCGINGYCDEYREQIYRQLTWSGKIMPVVKAKTEPIIKSRFELEDEPAEA